jgi:hypothetical protein
VGLQQLVGLDLDELYVEDCGMFEGSPTSQSQRTICLKPDPELVRAAPASSCLLKHGLVCIVWTQ